MFFNLSINCKQYTDYPQQDCWEIAQDMEHIDFLHKKTNLKIFFDEIEFNKNPNINRLYNKIKYRVIRKIFFFFKIKVEGYREINNDYEILQNEKFLFFNVNLNSKTLFDDNENKTVLDDTFSIRLPIIFYPLKKIFEMAITKHIKSQFLEDEDYRKRVHELRKRGIHKKYIFLNKPK
tara:strand:- start:107 stop:640 length:534 start_codon:yes stop_codon:yes gene_type:complete